MKDSIMTELTKLTICEAKNGLKNKDFTAVELTEAYVKKMDECRKLNAFVCEAPEQALERARVSQEKINKGEAGELEGIPLGIKDLFCTKGMATTACSNILKVQTHKTDRGMHPTKKAVKLMELLISLVTKEGQTVLDPFCGCGTTLVAAKNLKREYIGFEINKEYYDNILLRMQE